MPALRAGAARGLAIVREVADDVEIERRARASRSPFTGTATLLARTSSDEREGLTKPGPTSRRGAGGDTGLRGRRFGELLRMAKRIDADRLIRLVDNGAVLVDVLPAEVFAQEHLPGAVNIPLATLRAEHLDRLERGQPMVVYCFDQH